MRYVNIYLLLFIIRNANNSNVSLSPRSECFSAFQQKLAIT